MMMSSNHEGCTRHTDHENRIDRNEKDIQDIFKIIEKIQWRVALIVGGITAFSKALNHFGI